MSPPPLGPTGTVPVPLPTLLPLVREGDPSALGSLYARYAPGLLALVARLTQSPADAEDIVQDLFVGLPEALRRYQEEGRFEGWLRRIAIRLTYMRLRSARRRREVTLEGVQAPHDDSGNAGNDAQLEQALNKLEPGERILVVLRAVEGYSHAEIAALLGIKAGTAQVRYHRALGRLKSLMEAP